MLLEVAVCSFRVMVSPKGFGTFVFGKGLVNVPRESITRFVMSLDPETLATPFVHVAMELAITKSAVTARDSTGRVMDRSAMVAPLFAVLSNPKVKASQIAAVPIGS